MENEIKEKPASVAFHFGDVQSATFCNKVSPHQELLDKINAFDLSKHTPNDCVNFIYELQLLTESYG